MNATNINRKGRSIAEIFGLSSAQGDILAKRCSMIEATSQSIGDLFSGILRCNTSPEEIALVAYTLGARSHLFDETTQAPGAMERKITGVPEDLREYQ